MGGGLPEDERDVETPARADERREPVSALEPDPVDVVGVVPEVDRRPKPELLRTDGGGDEADVVIRLDAVAGRYRAQAQRADRRGHVELAEAGQRVAADRARVTAGRRS